MLGLRKVRRLSEGEAGEIADRGWRVLPAAKRESLPYGVGGQRRRVGVARAVAMNFLKVLLLDDHLALDPELVGEVLSVVAKLG